MPWLLKMTLFIALIMLMADCYIGWRFYQFIRKKQAQSWLKALFFLFLFSFYLYPLAGLGYAIFRGEPDMLRFWQPMTYWFWYGLVFSVHLFSWLIVLDVLKLFARFIAKTSRALIENIYTWVFGLMTIFLVIFTGVKMIHDTRSIQIKKMQLKSGKIPPGFDNFRIVHITDIQGDEFTGRSKIAKYIKKVNALHPDLVIFTGDLVSFGTDFISMSAQELGRAKSTYGTYAVIGDHDYWAGVSAIKSALQKNRIHVLQDRNKIITSKGDSLLLTGITEVYSKRIPRDSLRLLTHQKPRIPFRVMAVHQPSDAIIQATKQADYPLLLAGHTHGGQLCVPFLFMHFSAAELDTPYLSGKFKFGGTLMNVDNGLGFTLAPVRYNAQPSISVIDLKSK